MADVCTHLDQISPHLEAKPHACEECIKTGSRWVHLRRCLVCGHIGCCDSSPNHHATAHFHASGHPLIQSYERGEDWIWCYVDEVAMQPE